jgi:hypothetical protein
MQTSLATLRLLNAGDWACAFGEVERFAQVCAELMNHEPAVADEAQAIRLTVEIDLDGARRRWALLARALRDVRAESPSSAASTSSPILC